MVAAAARSRSWGSDLSIFDENDPPTTQELVNLTFFLDSPETSSVSSPSLPSTSISSIAVKAQIWDTIDQERSGNSSHRCQNPS
ncbi:hypothetical protein LOK49_LG11G00731 [Camellia lanceoleosa]|uniref:Uncharacterized protein n=1 Tax=Camellia lanceoleosa TaxID=1840588 RepID=A0ACC0G3A3_9ERIC|nr:hypothetical protein LOK49_LG11G00731 [Camellia lanceoleosa]